MSRPGITELVRIRESIAGRVHAVQTDQPDWPCRRGCDSCCRNLADEPYATAEEWRTVTMAVAALSPEVREDTLSRIETLGSRGAKRPVLCPFLDEAEGACRIYDARPLACRTYGFYVERGQGLYCSLIRERTELGLCAEIVWGNQAGVQRESKALGEPTSLTQWFRAHSDENLLSNRPR